MEPKDLTAEAMKAAIEKSGGFVSKACHELGCSRQHFYAKLKNYPTVQATMDEVRNKRHDFVESKLMELIGEGNVTAIIFYLKTQGHERGYTERHEVSGIGGEAIKFVEIVMPKDEDD